MIDTNIDLSRVVANPVIESINLARRINEYSAKYAAGGQLGIVLNKAGNQDMTEVYEFAKESDMEILGAVPYVEDLAKGSIEKDSNVIVEALKQLYFRLNLPQENN